MSGRPKVSVCMITYGHEKFVKQAVQGVLMQECEFEIELIVADDCSPDTTQFIVEGIIKEHPRGYRVKYVKHSENKGMLANFIWAMNQCCGDYIAFCEGDDYWTDSLKLQKQVGFLEANLDYGICFHNVNVFYQKENRLCADGFTRAVPETTTTLDLARGNYMHTPSVVMRNDFELPQWYSKSPLGDWPLYMIAAHNKMIKRLEDIMAVYRVHEKGVWALQSREYRVRNTIKSFELVLESKVVDDEVKTVLRRTIQDFRSILGKGESFVYHFFKYIKNKYLKMIKL
ncbi:glycosyltransferase family 2 protein [Snuella lapsa]|uniref:Glycosyltransferase 2-like domain-containing protein n=1 Tax=Snuella lapsa TaxID=870481 RepID=A0ABP6XSA0_9FLAO